MVWEQRRQYWPFFALDLHVWALNYVPMRSYFMHIEENSTKHLCFMKKNYVIKLIWKNLKVKIFDLTVELYCKVKNLNFKISINQLDKFIYFL